jgi:hypothetical protein
MPHGGLRRSCQSLSDSSIDMSGRTRASRPLRRRQGCSFCSRWLARSSTICCCRWLAADRSGSCRFDAALGFPLADICHLGVAISTRAGMLLQAVYATSLPQLLAILFFLGFSGRIRQLHHFLMTGVIGALLAIVCWSFFPIVRRVVDLSTAEGGHGRRSACRRARITGLSWSSLADTARLSVAEECSRRDRLSVVSYRDGGDVRLLSCCVFGCLQRRSLFSTR